MKTKRLIVTILVLLIITIQPAYGINEIQHGTSAMNLYQLGVFAGSEKGFELEREPTRLEGLIIMLKLIGREEAVSDYADATPAFTDVPDWGNSWATYAYQNGLASGLGDGQYGAGQALQAKSYMTFMLKALGYTIDAGDFTWDTALIKAEEIGLITFEERVYLETQPFLRDDLAYLSDMTLRQPMKDGKLSLGEYLVYKDYLDRDAAERIQLVSADAMETLIKLFVELPEDEYDTVEAGNMIDNIRHVPENYIEMMIEDGTRIRLINNPLTDEPEYTYLRGVVPRGWEATGRTWDDVPGAGGELIVARIGYSYSSEFHGSHNLELHEIGHQVDDVVFAQYGADSTTSLFAKLTDEEADLFSGPYYEYDEEFFAEAFTMYYLNDNTHRELKQKAPKVYDFFKNMETEYGYDE